MEKKIIFIIGPRPELIKLIALVPVLKGFNYLTIHSGQHYDPEMSKIFYEKLRLPKPNYYLGIGSDSHAKQTARIMMKCEEVLLKENPDLVIVFGDTNTTLGGALAASKLAIPIVHIEAGMRNYDLNMPEEINRKIVDHISTFFFCSSKVAVRNLKKEGIVKNIFFVGDLHYDICLKIKPEKEVLSKISIQSKNYFFATIHRQENTDNLERLKKIFQTLEKLELPVIFPIHPRTKKALWKLKIELKNVKLIKPVNFAQSLALQMYAKAVLTDSGGIQKEAYFLKIPCFTFRDSTEWVETVQSGWNKLVLANLSNLPNLVDDIELPTKHPFFYGTGKSAEKIAKELKKF